MDQVCERKKLGEWLCERSYISESALEHALSQQKHLGVKIGQVLLDLGYINQHQLNEALAHQVGIPRASLEDASITPELISMIPADLVSKHNLIPFARQNGHIDVAMTDPFSSQAIEELKLVTGCRVRRFYGSPSELEKAILKHYGSNVARMVDNLAPDEKEDDEDEAGEISAARLHELARQPSLVNLVNLILLEAIEARASDVHIEPFEKEVRIKYRVDGLLIEKSSSPKRLHAAIVSRIKIMGDMNIAERFVPQDGHIEFSGNKGKIDIRVSTVPTVFGESITMRILDRSAALISLEELGMNPQTLKGYNQCLNKSHGIVLVTGPTGSGKTTTLYAALRKIYKPSVKIITIEDPVEYQLDGIIQMPVNPRRGLTFSRGLRHILRQDPNIVMVGEIRDSETAEIAIRAALTGHLVFSTLHTNDAAGAITRLIDMGVEPFLLASSLEGVLAQRLVRRICPRCKTQYDPGESILRGLDNSVMVDRDASFYRGTGCDDCNHTGMRGRVGIFELLRVTETMRKLIANRPSSEELLRAAPADHVSMRHDGIAKMLAGSTTPEEVLRATQGVEEE
ncbi:Type II traffic warden ATPase [Anaerohalosphaera lusitana]|uniref:Type II traffic warden ATPase n=1 Tax=Anaerohalosphaera lusitana TaxID=1936003 RepID=A0A1U9NJS3_9BACT|nr:GspE/PulE family protein [Anaerohalosphaera lusitana]AQT68172.1 Type II traffic warden ATPase [Anaerohalosphaera lusitana]